MGDLLQLRDTHDQVQMLLPWHVNGTLAPDETAFVEAHLADCAECRADVAANRALRELYAATPPTERSTRPATPGALAGSTRPRASSGLSSGWDKAAKFAMAAAAAVAIVAIVVPRQGDDDFRLLGSEEAAETGNAIVLFSPETTERDLRAALEQAGARLVDGPTASGAYIVQVPEPRRAQALARLRALPHVVLAEPVDAARGP